MNVIGASIQRPERPFSKFARLPNPQFDSSSHLRFQSDGWRGKQTLIVLSTLFIGWQLGGTVSVVKPIHGTGGAMKPGAVSANGD